MPANITLESVASAATQVQKPNVVAAVANTAATTNSASTSPQLPNPRLTVDPSVNRVVLEFYSSTGVLTNTIPSQQQLEAYRLAAFSGNPLSAAESAGSA